MIVYGLIALALWSLTAVFVWSGFGNLYYGWVSETWPLAEATILRSEVEEVRHNKPRGDDGTPAGYYLRYRPLIEYQWQVKGHTYTRARRTFSSAQADEETREDAEAIIAPYPVGAKVNIPYDPGTPSRAILEPGPHWDGLRVTMVAALILAAFATTFSVVAWRSHGAS